MKLSIISHKAIIYSMPKKPPKKVAFKVLVPEELMPEINKLVADGDYNGY